MEIRTIPIEDIQTIYQLNLKDVAKRAGVDHAIVTRLFMGWGSVAKSDAQKVLAVLTQQTGRDYRLETVEIGCEITDAETKGVTREQ